MAINVDTLAGYIVNEIRSEFELEESNEGLQKYANATARAFARFLADDVEVSVGQQVAGQGVGEVSDGSGGTTTVNTEVTGKVTTKGGLI